MEKVMAADSSVPSWDGNPRTWRRFQKEISWYAMGSKPGVRKFLAPRVLAKLSGPARLLAMGWEQQEFVGPQGLQRLLQKLSMSPLVRRKLPNTASVMSQYLSFRRGAQESIATFLVKESLHFEEFKEALQLLKDERSGRPETFYIPEDDEEDDDDEDEDSPKKEKAYEKVPTEDPDDPPPRSPARSTRRDAGESSSDMDSFILEQLRGWRLLTAAALSPEEWRSVLASTNNKLDYVSVVSALEILYDEHFTKRPGQVHPGHHQPQIFNLEEDDEWNYEWEPTWDSSWMTPVTWDDWEWDEYGGEHDAAGDGDGEGPQGDADAMALDNGRSWSQAQRATQLMKKDRGFGAASSSASTGCFVCGSHQHMAKDCPDRNSPKGKGKPKGFGGGKGRWLHYMEDDWGYTYAMPMKGRKGKGKGKQAYMVEDYYANAFNFKGKGKSKSKGNHNVNAYMADIHDYYGLQFELQAAEEHQANDGDLDMAAVSAGTTCYGMLDSGATCSAGPEQSIKRLVQAVLTKDSAAQIKVDGQNRPRFRYGSGKWGRAQYHLEIKSSTSARTFQAFALPDPEEIAQPWFQDHMLVPVLVGMDFMKGNGMIVDFSDGLAVCAALDEDEPVQLPRNGKSHYMIDLVHFITGGKTNYVGSPTVQVINPLQEEDEPPTRSRSMTSHSLQYMMCPLQLQSHESEHTVISPQSSKSRHLFLQLWQRHVTPSPRQQARLMGNALAPKSSSTTSPTRSQAHGAQDDRDQGHGLGSHCSHGPSRPQEPSHSMAMHGEPHSHEVALQQVGSMEALLKVRSTPGVCPQDRSSSQLLSAGQPRECEEGAGGTTTRSTWTHGAQRGAGPRHDREGHCRGAHEDPPGGIPEELGQRKVQSEQSQGGSSSNDIPKVFQDRGLRRAKVGKSVHFDCQLGTGDASPHASSGTGLPAVPQRGREDAIDGSCSPTSSTAGPTGPLAERHGSGEHGAELRGELKEEQQCLPLRIGKAAMNLIHMLNEDFKKNLAELVYDGKKPYVWEMFCSPNSTITQCCEREGLNGVRIGLSTGFDLYKDQTYEDLKTVFKKQKPKKIWVSPMCTYFCDWVDLNYWYRRDVLNKHLRRERKMLRSLVAFLAWILMCDPTVELHWEWPRRCRGWKEPIVHDFFHKTLPELGQEVWWCRVDGCRYGLKDDQGGFLRKEWQFATTSISFYNEFRNKRCVGNHEHHWIHGETTNKTAYYPINLSRSIARNWAKQLLPDRWSKLLWTANEVNPAFKSLYALDDEYTPTEVPADFVPGDDPLRPAEEPADDPQGEQPDAPVAERPDDEPEPTPEDKKRWEAQLSRFHRSAGHPTNRNMARMLHDARLPKWKIKAAMNYSCPYCQETKPGGMASKQIPPGSLRPLPQAWEQVALDVGEWTVPDQDYKIKFLLMTDAATRFKVTEPLFVYQHGEVKVENSEMCIKAITMRWLLDKPRPKVLCPDNAKSLTSQQFVDFFGSVGIQVIHPPDQEPWAHGVAENAINLVKTTASKLQFSNARPRSSTDPGKCYQRDQQHRVQQRLH